MHCNPDHPQSHSRRFYQFNKTISLCVYTQFIGISYSTLGKRLIKSTPPRAFSTYEMSPPNSTRFFPIPHRLGVIEFARAHIPKIISFAQIYMRHLNICGAINAAARSRNDIIIIIILLVHRTVSNILHIRTFDRGLKGCFVVALPAPKAVYEVRWKSCFMLRRMCYSTVNLSSQPVPSINTLDSRRTGCCCIYVDAR